MNHMQITLSVLTLVLLSPSALADSWTITQSASATSTSTTILQENSSNGSVQAVNSVNLGVNGVINDSSSQSFIGGNNALTLRQNTGTASSVQAINRIYAHTINGATQGASLTGGPQALNFDQASDIGNNNTQSLNDATTSVAGAVNKLSQSVLDSTTVTLQMTQSAGTQNIQAGNLIKSGELSTTSGDATQTVSIGLANQIQLNTTQSIQSGNALITLGGNTAAGGTLTQSYSGLTLDAGGYSFQQTNANNSIQARNYAGEAL